MGALIRRLSAVAMLVFGLGVTGLTPAVASISNTRSDPSGTVELAGGSWLAGKGVDVYSNGSSAANDTGPHSTNGVYDGEMWQCVEMVNRLYLTRGWISRTWWGNGNQLYANAPASLTKQAQGIITFLNPGDVISFNGGGSAGHAAVVNSVSGSNVQIVNQNTSAVYSSATFSKGSLTMSGWAGYTIIGVIHAPTAPPPSITAPTLNSVKYANGGAGLYFTAPAVPAGTTIRYYRYQMSCDGGATLNYDSYTTGTVSPVIASGDCPLGSYGTYRLAAQVDAGTSAWSNWRTIGPPITAPTLNSVKYANGGAGLYFTAPAVPAGTTIRYYRYQMSCDGGATLNYDSYTTGTVSPVIASGDCPWAPTAPTDSPPKSTPAPRPGPTGARSARQSPPRP